MTDDSPDRSPLVRSKTRSIDDDDRTYTETDYYLSRKGWLVGFIVILIITSIFVAAVVVLALGISHLPDLVDAIYRLAETMEGIDP